MTNEVFPLSFKNMVFLLIIPLMGMGQTPERDSIPGQLLIVKGDSLFDQGLYFEARCLYDSASQILQSQPSSAPYLLVQRKIADAFRAESRFPEASALYFEVLHEIKSQPETREIIRTYQKVAQHLSSTNPSHAINYADTALQLVSRHFPDDTLLLVRSYFELANTERIAAEYLSGKNHYEKALAYLERLAQMDSSLLFRCHFRLGSVLNRLDMRDQAQYHYEQAEKVLSVINPDQNTLRNFYQHVAFLLDDLGDFEQALIYRQNFVNYYLEKGDSSSFGVSRAMNDLGLTYERRGEYQKALHWYEKTLENNTRIYGPESIYTAFLLNNVGNIYKHMGRYEEGLPLLLKAYGLFANYFGAEHIFPANVKSNIGDTYNLSGAPEKALPYNRKALAIRRSKLGPYHEDLARDYRLMGDIYTNMQLYDTAILYYDSSTYSTRYFEDQGFAPVIAHNRLYQALEQKALTYIKWSEQSGNLEHRVEASRTHMIIDKLTDFLRSSFRSEGSKRYLLANARHTYTKAVRNLVILYDQTGEQKYLDQAFAFSEKTRSILLQEALAASQVNKFAGVPEEIITEISNLKQKIAFLEKGIFKLQKDQSRDSLKLAEYQNNLFQVNNQYRTFTTKVERKYPDFFNLKFKLETQTLEELKDRLSAEQLYVEYLVSGDKLLVFGITHEDAQVLEIEIDNTFRQKVEDLRNSLFSFAFNRYLTDTTEEASLGNWIAKSRDLYEVVLAPLSSLLDQKTELIISPDQALNYLPFELLLSKNPEAPVPLKDLSYMLKTHAIQYVPSATLWQEMTSRKPSPKEKRVLAFAPSFDDKMDLQDMVAMRSGLGHLPFNENEVTEIGRSFPIKPYMGQTASKENFLGNVDQFSIVHLATHGKANDKQGDFSYLAFSGQNDTSTSNLLYASDIYNMKLQADMVVLSACETGIGELQQGEGLISLARAFSYAGTKSLITTLWAVNDEATSRVMASFYAHLKEGLKKPEALRQAKLDYLASTTYPEESHPFYWAGIISMGDESPLSISSFRSKPILIGTGILLVLLVGWVIFRKYRV